MREKRNARARKEKRACERRDVRAREEISACEKRDKRVREKRNARSREEIVCYYVAITIRKCNKFVHPCLSDFQLIFKSNLEFALGFSLIR